MKRLIIFFLVVEICLIGCSSSEKQPTTIPYLKSKGFLLNTDYLEIEAKNPNLQKYQIELYSNECPDYSFFAYPDSLEIGEENIPISVSVYFDEKNKLKCTHIEFLYSNFNQKKLVHDHVFSSCFTGATNVQQIQIQSNTPFEYSIERKETSTLFHTIQSNSGPRISFMQYAVDFPCFGKMISP